MKITNISELPHEEEDYKKTTSEILRKLKIQRDLISKVDDMLKLENNFAHFWKFCDCSIPVVFKYGNRYLITRDLEEVKRRMSEKKMRFADIDELPRANRGKTAKDFLLILVKIPIGKMWIPEKDEINVSTLRKAIDELEKQKKVKAGEYTATQRKDDKVVKVYVLHKEVE